MLRGRRTNLNLLQNALPLIALSAYLLSEVRSEEVKCSEEDFEYRYTGCEDGDERWRVAIPKSDGCNGELGPPTVKGPDCDFTCKPGEYFDIGGDQRVCQDCDPGTYSMGNGVSYAMFTEVPSDFTITNANEMLADKPCTDGGKWEAADSRLVARVTNCSLGFAFEVELVSLGQLTLHYKNTYNRASMIVIKVDNLCSRGRTSLELLKEDHSGSELSYTVDVMKGKNKISVSFLSVSGRQHSTLTGLAKQEFSISTISVGGMAFVHECRPCAPGFYSGLSSGQCTPCSANFYTATSKSNQCLPCPDGQYSLPGSSSCTIEPACSESDYVAMFDSCVNGTTNRTYSWITPMFCNPDLEGSVALPEPLLLEKCSPCNPGSHLVRGNCEFCPDGMFSDGGSDSQCGLCPVDTRAATGLFLHEFNSLPAQLSTDCVTTEENKRCDMTRSWLAKGDHLQVSDNVFDNQFAILHINISQLKGLKAEPLESSHSQIPVFGELTLDMEVTCGIGDACLLFLLMDYQKAEMSNKKIWDSTISRGVVRLPIDRHDISRISLAFRKNTRDIAVKSSSSTVKVYSIEVTNTVVGGAKECIKCPITSESQNGCLTCHADEIIVTVNGTSSCESCPAGKIVSSPRSCSACGPGLVPDSSGRACVSNCTFTDAAGEFYDLTKLSGVQTLTSNTMFTGDGTKFHSAFNFALCSAPNAHSRKAQCVSNYTEYNYMDDDESVSSMVCRQTILPSTTSTIALQPLSLGDWMTSVTNGDVRERAELLKYRVPIDDKERTLHFTYGSPAAISGDKVNCVDGQNTTITLICDPHQTINGTLALPPACSEGTCDGCHFMLVWRTNAACPVCKNESYQRVVEACRGGKQRVHYIPPYMYCPPLTESDETQSCSLLTLEMKIGILVAALAGILLVIIAICCWRRSRTLEYKYMKLVGAGSSSADGELPAAETCALDSSDEDDVVAFKAKGDRLFGNSASGQKDSFEKMKLVGSKLSEI